MRAEVYNRQAQQGSSLLVLFLIVMAILVCSAWEVTGQPIVYYSRETGKPVSIETQDGVVTVTPSTVLPEKYEKVWVEK